MAMKDLMTAAKDIGLLKYQFTARPHASPVSETRLARSVKSLGLDLDVFYKELLGFRKWFAIRELDVVSYEGRSYPVYRIDINRPKRGGKRRKKVFVLSGTHGNEQAGILCVIPFLQQVREKPEKYDHVSLRIVVPHNPVSAAHFSRFNGDGFDINRDFKRLVTKENRIVVEQVDDFTPDFSIALHEGFQKDMFVFTNNLVAKEQVLRILAYAKKRGIKLSTHSYFKNVLQTPGYFPVAGVSRLFMQLSFGLFGLQTFSYYLEDLGVPNITVETSWLSKSAKQRVGGQLAVLDGLVADLIR